MFVLATKLDLNVNDMRELLETSLKDHAEKFESLANKVNDNFQSLNSEIDKLKEENRIQNEKILQFLLSIRKKLLGKERKIEKYNIFADFTD